MLLTDKEIISLPKIDTHVNLNMDESSRTLTNSSDDLYSLVDIYAEQAIKNNVILSEIVYTPEVYTVPMDDGLHAVVNACKDSSGKNYNINASIQFLRDETVERALDRYEILKNFMHSNKKINHYISGITLGSYWNHLDANEYAGFLNKIRELRSDMQISVSFEINSRTAVDIENLMEISLNSGIRYSKFIFNGYGANVYEEDLFEDERVMGWIFDENIPIVISPTTGLKAKSGLMKQLARIIEWQKSGTTVLLSSDDYYSDAGNQYKFNHILENIFLGYDSEWWRRNGYLHWDKHSLINFMEKALVVSGNKSIHREKVIEKFNLYLNG